MKDKDEMLRHLKNMYEIASMVSFDMMQISEGKHLEALKKFREAEQFIGLTEEKEKEA